MVGLGFFELESWCGCFARAPAGTQNSRDEFLQKAVSLPLIVPLGWTVDMYCKNKFTEHFKLAKKFVVDDFDSRHRN